MSQKTRTCGGCRRAFALTNAFREWKTKTACSAQSGWKNSTGAITDSPGVRAAPSAAGRPPQARRGGCRRTRRRSAWPSPGRRWEDRPQPRRRDLVQLDKRRPLDDPADARPRVVRPLEVRLARSTSGIRHEWTSSSSAATSQSGRTASSRTTHIRRRSPPKRSLICPPTAASPAARRVIVKISWDSFLGIYSSLL